MCYIHCAECERCHHEWRQWLLNQPTHLFNDEDTNAFKAQKENPLSLTLQFMIMWKTPYAASATSFSEKEFVSGTIIENEHD